MVPVRVACRAVSIVFAIVVLLAAASGCASMGQIDASPEEVVSERAVSRWNALAEGEWEAAYAYLTPEYRSAVPLHQYRARFGGRLQWLEANVQSVRCSKDGCEVSLLVRYRHPRLGMENERPMTEQWVRRDGQWWKVQVQ